MVENFKLTAHELKRHLKISAYLPKSYHNTNNSYPIIYILDGQLFFPNVDNENLLFDNSKYASQSNKEFICIGIHSPKNPDWRLSELLPFYNGNNNIVDSSLAYNLSEYISTTLHEIIKQRYRINDNVYILGFNEGAVFSLYNIYKYPLYKGAGIFNPTLNICSNYIEYVDNNYSNKYIYLYSGIDDNNNDYFY